MDGELVSEGLWLFVVEKEGGEWGGGKGERCSVTTSSNGKKDFGKQRNREKGDRK